MTRVVVLGLAAALLVPFVVLPLVLLGGSLVAEPGALAVIARPLEREAAWNTVLLALGTTAFALFAGLPLGVLVARTDLPGAARWRVLATLPYVVPPYVSAIAWIALLNPTNGMVNRGLRAVGLPVLDVYGLPGMVLVMGLECTPLVMIATADALSRMDASLEEQARVAGAGPFAAVARVTLPLAAPAIVAACSFVLASTAAAFGVPYLLATGSAEPTWVLTTRIAQALDLDPTRGRPIAVALAAELLLVGVALPALLGLWLRGRSFTTVAGKAARPAPLRLGRWRPLAVAGVAAFVGVGAVLPLATLVATSLLANVGAGLLPENLTLASYEAALSGRNLAALGRSAWLAAWAATGAVALGGLLAYLGERTATPGRRALGWLARVPYTVPGTVLALGLLLAWSQEVRLVVADRVTFALALADTAWLLGLAYLVKFLALPVGQVTAGLRSVDRSLEEAARVAGAGWGQAMWRVTGPLLLPNLAAAWFLVFLPAFTEVTMSVLLSGPRTRVVGAALFELQTYGDPPGAAALGVVVTAVVVAGHAVATRLARRA